MVLRDRLTVVLETSAVVSLTASITLINTQLIHQFVTVVDAWFGFQD